MLGFFGKSKQPFSGMDAVSLTEYFEDTVRKIARANMRAEMAARTFDKEKVNPDNIACLLYLGGKETARRHNSEIEPVQGREMIVRANGRDKAMTKGFNLEDGLIVFCDVSREAYGLSINNVYSQPYEIREIEKRFEAHLS